MNTYSEASSETQLELREVTIPQIPKTTPSIIKDRVVTQKAQSISEIHFSQPYISYGFLVPGEAIIRSDTVLTRTSNKDGGTLYIFQNGLLTAKEQNAVIPNTSCDAGGCNPSLASIWESSLTFGFGIRCENSSCLSDFSQDNAFRPLSSTGAYPYSRATDTLTESEIIYKLNIAPNQSPQPYTNKVTYIIVPNL
jgi:hypothetical protein